MKTNNAQIDTLEQSQKNFDLGHSHYSAHYGSPMNQNKILKNVYKQQLDSLLQQKNQMKQQQRTKQQQQKKQYNQRLHAGQQVQKMKQASYKNYYNMLLNNQTHIQNNYISPFAQRDNLKNQHILTGVEENKRKMEYLDKQRRRLQSEKRNNYRNQLFQQIQQKKRRQIDHKQQIIRNQEQFRKYSRLPDQIKQIERQRKWQEMNKYKQDLDRVKNDKDTINRTRVNTLDPRGYYVAPQQERHHALINPLPYNIQNPYILKEISRQQQIQRGGF